jgi:hypothetical protein
VAGQLGEHAERQKLKEGVDAVALGARQVYGEGRKRCFTSHLVLSPLPPAVVLSFDMHPRIV